MKYIMISLALLISAPLIAGPASQNPRSYKKKDGNNRNKKKTGVVRKESSRIPEMETLAHTPEMVQPEVSIVDAVQTEEAPVEEGATLPLNSPVDFQTVFENDEKAAQPKSIVRNGINEITSCLGKWFVSAKTDDEILEYRRKLDFPTLAHTSENTSDKQIVVYSQNSRANNRLIFIGDALWLKAFIERAKKIVPTFFAMVPQSKVAEPKEQQLLLTYPKHDESTEPQGIVSATDAEMRSIISDMKTAPHSIVLLDQAQPKNRIIILGDDMWVKSVLKLAQRINSNLPNNALQRARCGSTLCLLPTNNIPAQTPITATADMSKLADVPENKTRVKSKYGINSENTQETPAWSYKQPLVLSGLLAAASGIVYKCISYLKADKDSDATVWQRLKAGVQKDAQAVADTMTSAKDASVKFVKETSDKVRAKARAAANAVSSYYKNFTKAA